jgi:hypothetical protein
MLAVFGSAFGAVYSHLIVTGCAESESMVTTLSATSVRRRLPSVFT